MKLLIYYSLTGNLDIASNILRDNGYDAIKVVPKEHMPKTKFGTFAKLGFEALVHKKAKLVDFDPDLSKYDEIVIASPIWNKRICSPINTVIKRLNLNDKKVTFILSSASGNAKNALRRLNKKNMTSRVIILKDPKNHPEELDKIRNL